MDLETKGALVTCDIIFPAHTHDWLSDFPPIYEKKIHEPSEYPLRYSRYKERQYVPKLTPHLAPAVSYTATMQEIRIIVDLGGVITTVSSILLYDVKPFARNYLRMLQKWRAEAISDGNDPLSTFIKLMGNSCYGKFNQSNEKYLDIKLVTSMEDYEKAIRSVRFVKVVAHANSCITTQRRRVIRQEALVLVAAHILGSSKSSLLQKFYYVLKPAFATIPTSLTPSPNLRLCYIDTDCLVIEITMHIIDFILRMKSKGVAEHFDFSNLAKDNPLYNDERKDEIGILKDEVKGRLIKAFYASSAKCYQVLFEDASTLAKCKGVPKAVSSAYTTEMYRDSALLSNVQQYSTFRRIGLTNTTRQMALIELRKRTLNGYDTKRIITNGGLDSIPFGHRRASTERHISILAS